MSKPRGRCDIRAKDQTVETPKRCAPISECSAHYNRLELAPLIRVSPAAMPPAPLRASAEIRTSFDHHCQIIEASTKPWINSFLVHQEESCNKQVSGATGLG